LRQFIASLRPSPFNLKLMIDCGRCRRADERCHRRPAVGRGSRDVNLHSRLSPHGWRYALHCRRYRRRRGHPASPAITGSTPFFRCVIAALILWSSFGIVRETLNILLEGTPRGVSLPVIRSGMEAVEGVLNVHDLHVWCLGSQSRALACHVTIKDIPPSESACILLKLNQVLRDRFQISHTTIQFEHTGCQELEGCVVPMEEMAGTHSHHGHGH
jgi:hypothetical protein